MRERLKELRWLVWAAVLLPQAALASENEPSSLIVIAASESEWRSHREDAYALGDLLRGVVEDQGRALASLNVEASSRGATTLDAAAVQQLGGEVFRRLAAGEAPEVLLADYDPKIRSVLVRAGAARAPDTRSLAWNLCVLRVQLHQLTSDPEGAQKAVRECKRRFLDQQEFSEAWDSDVREAFAQEGPTALLEVFSAPANCSVWIYGAEVGKTPLRVPVQPGPQAVEVQCGADSRSRVHFLDVQETRRLTIRMTAEAALSSYSRGVAHLSYPLGAEPSPRSDAAALAEVAGASEIVLVRLEKGRAELSRYDGSASRASVSFPLGVSSAAAVHQALALYESPSPSSLAPSGSRREVVAGRRRDLGIGAGLLLAGVGLLGPAAHGYATAGSCDNGCNVSRFGRAALGAGVVLAASGLVMVAWRPFERHELRVGLGVGAVQLGGRF